MATKGSGIMGLSVVNGCWLAQVAVDGVRHRRTFGAANSVNAKRAVEWLEGLRAQRTAELPPCTAQVVEAGSANALARIEAWEGKKAKQVLTMAQRVANNKKVYAAKKKRK